MGFYYIAVNPQWKVATFTGKQLVPVAPCQPNPLSAFFYIWTEDADAPASNVVFVPYKNTAAGKAEAEAICKMAAGIP